MILWLPGILFSVFVAGIVTYLIFHFRSYNIQENNQEIEALIVQLERVRIEIQTGQISEIEGNKLEAEIGRRIIANNRKFETQPFGKNLSPRHVLVIAFGVGAFILIGSQFLHNSLGMPGYRDQPIKIRLAESQKIKDARLTFSQAYQETSGQDFDLQVALATETMKRWKQPHSDNQVIYLIRVRDGFRDSFLEQKFVQAWAYKKELISLLGPDTTLQDYLDLLNATVLATNLYITPDAEELINEILTRDQNNYTANFYLGLMYNQINRPDRTFTIWNRLLLEDTETTNPWKTYIEANLTEIANQAGIR